MPVAELKIEKLDAPLGARVSGLDLREPLDPTVVAALREYLFEYQVLFFREQALDDDQHMRFAENFGRPNVYPLTAMLGSHKPIEFVWDGPNRRPTASNWHTDVTWLQSPPKIGSLAAQVIPESGGDTLWCSLYSIHEALPPELREEIRDLVVQHGAGPGFIDLVVRSIDEDLVEPFQEKYGAGAQHSLIRDHYVSGKPLVYLAGGFMDHIVGMDIDRGRDLLSRLMKFASDPAHQIRWKWAVDDVAIWDERSTMHHVDASHWPEPRKMRRCTVG